MKSDRTLLQKLTPFFFLAVGIPIAVFAMFSQFRLQKSLSDSLTTRIEENLSHADRHTDMVLDKYNTLLYDFCTDDEIISIMNAINENGDELDINSSKIRKELSHICSRNNDIVGITIFTNDNQVIFYDRMSATSVNSTWAAQVKVEGKIKGTVYQGVTEPIDMGQDKVYTFRLARKLTDYRDVKKDIGTVVMSIDESVLREALKSGSDPNFLYQDGVVVSAPDSSDIGKKKEQIETGNYRISTVQNEMCGLYIMNRQSMDGYYKTLSEQAAIWVLITIATMGITAVLSYALTRPYLKEIDTMAEAMSEVEKGNFKMRLPVKDNMSVEIHRISSGFNEMVSHIEELIERVKEAILEQRSAELSALEAQIDPHFLYNTLDAINWKAIEKGEFEISEMVGALGDILRYTVKNPGDESTVEQELYWLHQYILLQSAKAGKDLQVVMDVPEEIKGCRIHKLLLQPFVENAIKHGMKRKCGECNIVLTMRKSGSQIHIMIKDNGCGIELQTLDRLNSKVAGQDSGHDEEYEKIHLGVMNVRKRLNLYYDDKADLYFESELGLYTKVHLFIPQNEQAEGGGNNENCCSGR